MDRRDGRTKKYIFAFGIGLFRWGISVACTNNIINARYADKLILRADPSRIGPDGDPRR